jgi:hypothetical protein
VYALSSLNFYRQYGSNSAAIVGYLQYVTQDPDTRVPSEHVTSAWGGDIYTGVEVGGWLAPSFLDENVIEITLAWNCYADSSSGNGIFYGVHRIGLEETTLSYSRRDERL